MDPFVLARNAFNIYCSEYTKTNIFSSQINQNTNNNQPNINIQSLNQNLSHKNEDYERAIDRLNERYEYFLHTLDRLKTSWEYRTKNHNVNSMHTKEMDLLTSSSSNTSKRSKKKRLNKKSIQQQQQQMPKVHITVSCAEHRVQQQQSNIKIR